MATKQELIARIQTARAALQQYDSAMADIVLSMEEDHGAPLDDDIVGDGTSALYDEITEVEACVQSLP